MCLSREKVIYLNKYLWNLAHLKPQYVCDIWVGEPFFLSKQHHLVAEIGKIDASCSTNVLLLMKKKCFIVIYRFCWKVILHQDLLGFEGCDARVGRETIRIHCTLLYAGYQMMGMHSGGLLTAGSKDQERMGLRNAQESEAQLCRDHSALGSYRVQVYTCGIQG